jgi:uncharacterized iron-regulated membrane protein
MRKGSFLYKRILDLHLYLALITGIVMIVLAVSGCLLIFERKIDRWVNPSLAHVTPQGEQLPFTTILQQLNAALPGLRAQRLDQDEPDSPVVATMSDKSRVYINGYTGEILGTRQGQSLTYYVEQFHVNLLAGRVGSWIVAIATFALLFQSVSGLYLWWPIKRMSVKLKGSWLRLNFDLHHAVGFYSALFVCILCLTGIARYYADSLQPLVNRWANSSTVPRALPSRNIPAQTDAASKITIDDAVTIAKDKLPGGNLARIILPATKKDSFVVSVRFPGDEQPSGRSWAVVDQYSGEVLSSLDMRYASTGSQFSAITRSIHTGDLSGWPTRLLVGLASFSVVLQTISGFIMWWKRKRFSLWQGRKRKRLKRKRNLTCASPLKIHQAHLVPKLE